jgi:plastocyanin
VVGRVSLAAALAVSSAAVALAAAPPRSRTVQVRDASLKPATATVAVGGSVTWRNRGRKSHRITSDTRAWAGFALKPTNGHTVKFERAGRYRYHVDGKRRGVVIVVAAPANRPVAWVGTIDSQTSRQYSGNAGSCTDAWHADLAFTVTAGTIEGSGQATLTAGPDCTAITNHTAVTEIVLGVVGTSDAKTLNLKLLDRGDTPGLPAALWAGYGSDFPTTFGDSTLTVPKIDACTARGSPTTTATFPTGDYLVSNNTIELRCR